MAVSEEEVKEEENIQEDLKKAKEIMNRILKDPEIFEGMLPDLKPILFALCLIYTKINRKQK
jgi:surfactin synthase thioesterase subunit